MLQEMHRLFPLLLLLLSHGSFSTAAAVTGGCNRWCGDAAVPYPFGFSTGCPIQLSCNATTSTPISLLMNTTAAMVPVLSFNSTSSTLRVPLRPLCNRTVSDTKRSLSGANYVVSSSTILFVSGDCGRVTSNCSVSSNVISPMLRKAQCANTTVTCMGSTPLNATTAARGEELFLQWRKVENSSCGDVLTAVVYRNSNEVVVSLELGVAELGWWLNGTCTGGNRRSQCATNAMCADVRTPSGSLGHRCVCPDGMDGDGFTAGDGCYPAKRSSSKDVPFIVGGVLAGVAAAGGVLLLCRVQCRRYAAGRSGSDRLAAMLLLSEAAASSGVPVYSYNEVARATNSFSHTHRLGTGAYGTVYVGKLPASSPSFVAIKRLRYRHDDDDETAVALLLNEIKLISSLSHPNLVRLLGCCLDLGEQILVYEFVPNGTLSHHLLGGGRLPWRARLGVAAETAAVIAYLHAMRPPIFHRDVKSSNILLDGDLRPKLADFGLSRAVHLEASHSHISTAPQGTPGYVDPEYHQNFHLSDKSDVYSFGVVLLELITAMKVVDFGRPASEVNLASLALDRIGKGRVDDIVDPVLVDHGEEWVMGSVRHVSELAFRCLAFQKDVRPCMREVTAELRRIRDAAPASIDVGFDGPDKVAKKAGSPVSVQEVWVSDQSSPSTNGSMPRFGVHRGNEM